MTTLDCGHEPTPRGMTSGTAHTADGRTLCIPCAEQSELATFLATDPGGSFIAYLSSDKREVTTWTGIHLARVTSYNETNAGFGGGWRSGSGRVYLQAIDERGQHWYGNTPGAGMYARMRRNRVPV